MLLPPFHLKVHLHNMNFAYTVIRTAHSMLFHKEQKLLAFVLLVHWRFLSWLQMNSIAVFLLFFLFICQKTIDIKPHTLTNLQTSIQWDATQFPEIETNTLSDSSHELVVFYGLTKKRKKNPPMSQK